MNKIKAIKPANINARYRRTTGMIPKKAGQTLIVLNTNTGDFFQLTGAIARLYQTLNARQTFFQHATKCFDYAVEDEMIQEMLQNFLTSQLVEKFPKK